MSASTRVQRPRSRASCFRRPAVGVGGGAQLRPEPGLGTPRGWDGTARPDGTSLSLREHPPSPGLGLPVRAKYAGAYLWALRSSTSCFLPTEQPGVTSCRMMIFRGLLMVGCFSLRFLAPRYIHLSWLKAFLCFCGCKRITCVVLTIWQ